MFQIITVQTSHRDSRHIIHLFHFQQVIGFHLVSGHLLWYYVPTQYHSLQEVLNKVRLCLAGPTISSSLILLFLLITYTHCQIQSTADDSFHFRSVPVACLLSCCNHVVFDLNHVRLISAEGQSSETPAGPPASGSQQLNRKLASACPAPPRKFSQKSQSAPTHLHFITPSNITFALHTCTVEGY